MSKELKFWCGGLDIILFSDAYISIQWSGTGAQLQWKNNAAGSFSMVCHTIKVDGTTVVTGGDFTDTAWNFLTSDGLVDTVRNVSVSSAISCQFSLIPYTNIPFHKISFVYGKNTYYAALIVEVI